MTGSTFTANSASAAAPSRGVRRGHRRPVDVRGHRTRSTASRRCGPSHGASSSLARRSCATEHWRNRRRDRRLGGCEGHRQLFRRQQRVVRRCDLREHASRRCDRRSVATPATSDRRSVRSAHRASVARSTSCRPRSTATSRRAAPGSTAGRYSRLVDRMPTAACPTDRLERPVEHVRRERLGSRSRRVPRGNDGGADRQHLRSDGRRHQLRGPRRRDADLARREHLGGGGRQLFADAAGDLTATPAQLGPLQVNAPGATPTRAIPASVAGRRPRAQAGSVHARRTRTTSAVWFAGTARRPGHCATPGRSSSSHRRRRPPHDHHDYAPTTHAADHAAADDAAAARRSRDGVAAPDPSRRRPQRPRRNCRRPGRTRVDGSRSSSSRSAC